MGFLRDTLLLELFSQCPGDFLPVFCWIVGESVNDFLAWGFPLVVVTGVSFVFVCWGVHCNYCYSLEEYFVTDKGQRGCLGPSDMFGDFHLLDVYSIQGSAVVTMVVLVWIRLLDLYSQPVVTMGDQMKEMMGSCGQLVVLPCLVLIENLKLSPHW